ncbi:Altered inheritance of mitochondria protein [Lachnellula subtilissima]|uniref:Altered inheritance of mitochondria protein 11 n=1 Tax=Lachnellula subtilissima TaxID=602034 RepID=A0A8H8RJA7_9HELO|nr:Altered inheritance of mitochondria protein [Lachnellula subtilissima]
MAPSQPAPVPAPALAPPATPTAQQPASPEYRSSFFSQRSRRQLGLFFAGAGFFAVTTAITRRSIVRRYKATIPKFYQPNNRPGFEVNGAMEAFEALNIATINVLSVGMTLGGGLLWALDVSSIDDMRRKVRINMGVNASPEDSEAEKEIEEMIATILERKEFKHLLGKEKEKGDEKEEKETKGEADQRS